MRHGIVTTVFATLFLAACQTTHPYAGSGQVSLSRKVESHFQSYLAHPGGTYFAITENGQFYGYSTCSQGRYGCTENSGTVALRSCHERSEGVPCKIYAVGDDIVWQGIERSGKTQKTPKTDIGRGPIVFSESAKRTYKKYLNLNYPQYLAVTPDGRRASYSFCQRTPCLNPGLKAMAVSYCARNSGNQGCLIYAIGDKVVWQGLSESEIAQNDPRSNAGQKQYSTTSETEQSSGQSIASIQRPKPEKAVEEARKKQQATLERQKVVAKTKSEKPTPDTTPPVVTTASELKTAQMSVNIQGRATDDVKLARLELNGEFVKTKDGEFSVDVPVAIGQSRLRLTAYDEQGNETVKFISILRARDIPEIAFGNYHALVIGINNYKSLPKLSTAVTDAQVVAETLKDLYGFAVTLLENPSRDEIIDAFDGFRDSLGEQDNLLIYYAGHGWLDQQTGTGYWLPVNAKADRRSRWVSNATLTNALQNILAKHVIVVADSCYSGSLTRSFKVPHRNKAYMTRISEKHARVVLSSGGLEPVVDSGGGKHSVFAKQFLKALRDNQGVLDGTQLFEKVRHSVILNADQTPQYSDIRRAGHEGGDFLFVRKY